MLDFNFDTSCASFMHFQRADWRLRLSNFSKELADVCDAESPLSPTFAWSRKRTRACQPCMATATAG